MEDRLDNYHSTRVIDDSTYRQTNKPVRMQGVPLQCSLIQVCLLLT